MDISAGVDLIESNSQVDVSPVYVPRDFSVSVLKSFRNDIKEFRSLISKIESLFGISGKFSKICVDYTSNRDAFGFKHCILCNLAKYQKEKSFSFWLVTLAKEFAYLIHPRRDMRHMNLMRELLVKALDILHHHDRTAHISFNKLGQTPRKRRDGFEGEEFRKIPLGRISRSDSPHPHRLQTRTPAANPRGTEPWSYRDRLSSFPSQQPRPLSR